MVRDTHPAQEATDGAGPSDRSPDQHHRAVARQPVWVYVPRQGQPADRARRHVGFD